MDTAWLEGVGVNPAHVQVVGGLVWSQARVLTGLVRLLRALLMQAASLPLPASPCSSPQRQSYDAASINKDADGAVASGDGAAGAASAAAAAATVAASVYGQQAAQAAGVKSDSKHAALGGAQALLLHCCQQCVLLSIALAELADKAADVVRRDADVSASGFESLSVADVAGRSKHHPTMILVVIVVSLLLLRASQPPVMAQIPSMPGGQIGGEAGIERVMSLFRIWEEAYGLKPDVHLPPAKITLPAIVPRAPHLEDCAALTAARRESERCGGDGQPPLWSARRVENCSSDCTPQPPWVRGSDSDNLPLTRVAQRDLWEHQLFHGSCDGKRLLVVPWPNKTHHGVGSQIHVMSTFLSLALIHNRTLVPAPGSYDRAYTETCNSTGTGGAWGCYFFPIVNPDCERVVSDMIANSTMPPLSSDKTGHNRLAASGDPVVYLNSSCDSQMKFEARAATLWGDAYARASNVVEYMGEQPPVDTKHPMVHWWRSQSTRFMLRWPSLHTCHETNKQRHTAYGLLTASHLSRYTETQSEILRAVAGNSPIIAGNASETPESKKLAEISAGPPGPIETQVWPVRGFAGCDETCMGAADAKAIRETYAAVGGEPFVMRPIVSVHVRQSDKGTEMRLSPLATHMFFAHRLRRYVPDLRYVWLNTEMEASRPKPTLTARLPLHVYQSDKGTEMRLSPLATHMFFVHRLRRHVPDLRYVWLNTEMESVVKESALYVDWKFLYSSNSRQPVGSRSGREYELTQSVAASFASAIIASQCDYFVGALGSNWSRLINELRSTNGRLLSGFYTVNTGDCRTLFYCVAAAHLLVATIREGRWARVCVARKSHTLVAHSESP
ncbi:unnamed protein product [Closterium sp. Yama58-4]|nr:unnamed protein product [Closterium sp. Yama58-4]